MPDIEKTALINNWLGRKWPQIWDTITQTEKGKMWNFRSTIQNTKWQIQPQYI